MDTTPPMTRLGGPGVVAALGGAAPALLGLVVLFGWYTHNQTLIQVSPAFVPMQYNTALGFLAGGLGLLACVRGFRRWALGLGALTLAIGGLTVVQYLSGLSLGIDQLLMTHYITTETSHPGRMAPNTALCYTLTGAGLVTVGALAPSRDRDAAVGVLGSLVFGLGFIAFSGYAVGLETAYGWGHLTRMAVHTSAGFIVLGVGLAAYAWHAGWHDGRHDGRTAGEAPDWLPLSVGIGILTITASLWQALTPAAGSDSIAHHFVLAFGVVLAAAMAVTVSLLWSAKRGARAREAELRVALDSMPGGFIMTDPDLNIRLVNNEFLKASGLSADLVKPGVSHESVFRHMAENGFMGELDDIDAAVAKRMHSLVNPTDQIMSYTTPDGRNHEVRRRRTADGHLISISMEVTDRIKAEQAVRENEARFRGIFETGAAGMALLAMDGTYVQANDRFCEIVGYTEAELLTLTWRDLTHPDEIATVEEMDRRVEAGETPDFYMERRLIRKDGTVIWTNLSSAQLRDENGVSKNIFSFIQDITDLKEAERLVRENEKNLRELLDSGPIGVGVVDQETNERLFANRQLAEMMGVGSADELTASNLEDSYVNPEEVERLRRAVSRGGTIRNVEVQRRRPDGSTFWALQSAQALGSFQGRDARVVWMVDIDALKSAQAELAAQKAIIDTAMANMAQGISMFDDDLNMLAFNDRFIELLDFPDELARVGTPLSAFFRYNAERGEYGEGDIDALVRERIDLAMKFEAHEFQRELSDGKTIVIKGQPVRTGGFVTTYMDITETIEAQRGAKLLAEALDTFSDMVILYDRNERVIFTNDRYHEIYPNSPPKDEITSYTMEGLLRRSLEAGQISHPLAQEDPEGWLQQALASRRNKDGGSGETTHANGRTYFYRYSWTTEGGMILVQFDITERKHMEEALKASEQQLRQILENSPVAVAISVDDQTDADGIIQFCNPRFAELIGMGADEVGTARTRDFFKERKSRAEHERMLDDGRSLFDLETVWQHRDGTEIWTMTSVSPIQYEARKSALIWIYDITELKRTQHEIAEQEARLRLALENMPGAMWLVDKNLELVFANDQYVDFYGDPGGLVKPGGAIIDIVRQEAEGGLLGGDGEVDDLVAERVRSYRAKTPSTFEDKTPDGRDLQLMRRPTDDGHVISVVTDISALKQAERLVEAQRAQLDDILRNVQQGIVVCDKDQNIVAWNPQFPKIVQFDEAALERGATALEVIVSIADRGSYGDGDPEALARERLDRLWVGDVRADLAFGDGRSYEVHSTRTPDGGLIATYTDITERKAAERIISNAMAQINESIQYASRIQRAVLPSADQLAEVFADHFVIWEPKDVVGGDMLWLRRVDGGHLLIVADCTGHGPPGAFMTMIATGALDQAISEIPDGDPAEVIAYMNRVIKAALGQDQPGGGSDDGLELAACRVVGPRLTFAGARASLNRLRGRAIDEIKGDKSGIGYRRVPTDRAFTNIEVEATPKDRFYIWTDGITDQIGGPKRRSYGKRRVKSGILDYHRMKMPNQRAQLLRDFEDYQHNEERRDDISFIGFKLKG